MSSFARDPDTGVNTTFVEKENQSTGSKHEDFVDDLVAPQEPEGHVIDGKTFPSAEDAPAERAVEDLEALHQAPSGPAYSVFNDHQRKLIIIMVACAGFFSPLSANIYFRTYLHSPIPSLEPKLEVVRLVLAVFTL